MRDLLKVGWLLSARKWLIFWMIGSGSSPIVEGGELEALLNFIISSHLSNKFDETKLKHNDFINNI